MEIKLKITSRSWTGWQEEQPSPKEATLDVKDGEVVDLVKLEKTSGGILGRYLFSFKPISENKVTLHLIGGLTTVKNTADTEKITESVELERGSTLDLYTVTLDGGWHFQISWE